MKDREDFFVRVTLSPEQARTVIAALDFYARIMSGQFDELTRVFSTNLHGQRDEVDRMMSAVRAICLPKLHPRDSGYGIAECPNEWARIAFDILQVIRQVEIIARSPDGPRVLVSYDSPHFVSASEPRPVAKAINTLDRLAEI
jgi:hypothetical protein